MRGCGGGVPIFYYLRCNNFKSCIMKIKFGMMITDGRGKLGGQVASKNRSGSYIRTKVTPVNPQTSFQTAVRQRLGMLSSAWGSMLERQRLNWNGAANSDQWNKSDIFGDSRRPTGKNLFTGINLVRLETTGTMSPSVPKKADFTQFALNEVKAYTNGEVGLNVTFDEAPAVNAYLQIECTTAVSPGRYYLKNLYRSVVSETSLTNGSNVLDITDEYEERFGELTASNLGQRVGFRVRQVIDGQPTPWVALSTVVTTAP